MAGRKKKITKRAVDLAAPTDKFIASGTPSPRASA